MGDLVVGDLRRTKKAAARIELQPFFVENELAVTLFEWDPIERIRPRCALRACGLRTQSLRSTANVGKTWV